MTRLWGSCGDWSISNFQVCSARRGSGIRVWQAGAKAMRGLFLRLEIKSPKERQITNVDMKMATTNEDMKYTRPNSCGINSPITAQTMAKRITPIIKMTVDIILRNFSTKAITGRCTTMEKGIARAMRTAKYRTAQLTVKGNLELTPIHAIRRTYSMIAAVVSSMSSCFMCNYLNEKVSTNHA
jgi:hypothetical protein